VTTFPAGARVQATVEGILMTPWAPGGPVLLRVSSWNGVQIPLDLVKAVADVAYRAPSGPNDCPLCGMPVDGHNPGWCAQKAPDPVWIRQAAPWRL
jgi:hypothetical protein